jgi:hypothetical protein
MAWYLVKQRDNFTLPYTDFTVIVNNMLYAPGWMTRQKQIFSLLYKVQTGSEAHPASCPMGIGFISPGIKRPEREADHSH